MTANIVSIYDFGTQLDDGFKLALQTSENIQSDKVFTLKSMFAADANKEFQWPRPRIQVRTTPGAAMRHYVIDSDSNRRNTGFSARLEIAIITGPDQTIHSGYCAIVRERAAIFDQLLDDDVALLPFHQVPQCTPAGETEMTKNEDGAFVTIMNFEFFFNIRPDAWTS